MFAPTSRWRFAGFSCDAEPAGHGRLAAGQRAPVELEVRASERRDIEVPLGVLEARTAEAAPRGSI
jgi:hypothetical protein